MASKTRPFQRTEWPPAPSGNQYRSPRTARSSSNSVLMQARPSGIGPGTGSAGRAVEAALGLVRVPRLNWGVLGRRQFRSVRQGNDENRARGDLQQAYRDAAEDDLADQRVASGSDDDQVRGERVGGFGDHVCGAAEPDGRVVELGLDARILQVVDLRGDPGPA